jgi:hypothetical protein
MNSYNLYGLILHPLRKNLANLAVKYNAKLKLSYITYMVEKNYI